MQAVILAGGVGSRLRPITETMPKPLCPIAKESAMGRVLKLLALHGCRDAVVTLCYLPRRIADTFQDSAYGIRLHYVYEDKPCGTAGSVKLATPFLEEDDFLVLSADVVCETDLGALFRYHKEKKALATLALTHQCEVGEYGVVVCRSDGQIAQFLEKPARSQACSDTVNSGIYCLNRAALANIPQGKVYDFGKDLFPSMLGNRLYGYVDSHDWCDIGSLESYYDCNFRIARKEGKLQDSNIIADGVSIDATAKVEDSILFPGVNIGAYCQVKGAILCEDVTLCNHVKVEKGAVIGAKSRIEAGCRIGQNVILPACKTTKAHSVSTVHYTYASNQTQFFSDGGLHGRKEELTPEFLLQFGRAVAKVANGKTVAVLHADTPYCSLLCSAFRCGVIGAGGTLFYDGIGFCAYAAFCAKENSKMTFCIYEDADSSVRVAIYDENGLYPHRKIERALCQAFGGQDPEKCTTLGTCEAKESMVAAYQKCLQQMAGDLEGLQLYLNYTAPAVQLRAATNASGAKASASAEALRLVLDPTGRNVAVFESGEAPFSCDFWHVIAILMQHGRLPHRLALPYSAPMAICEMAKRRGDEILFYTSCPHDETEHDVRALAAQQPILRDASMACCALLRLVKESAQSVRSLSQNLPSFFTFVREMPAEPQTRVKVLCALGKTDGEGVCVSYSASRRVRILPAGAASYRMICEAESVEAADEIFALSRQKIRTLMEEYQKKKEGD